MIVWRGVGVRAPRFSGSGSNEDRAVVEGGQRGTVLGAGPVSVIDGRGSPYPDIATRAPAKTYRVSCATAHIRA